MSRLEERIRILSFGKTDEQIAEIRRRETLLSMRGPNRYTINEEQRLGKLGQRSIPKETPFIFPINFNYQNPFSVSYISLPGQYAKYNTIYQYGINKVKEFPNYSSLITIDMANDLYTLNTQKDITDVNIKSVLNNGRFLIIMRDSSFESTAILNDIKSIAKLTGSIDINEVQIVNTGVDPMSARSDGSKPIIPNLDLGQLSDRSGQFTNRTSAREEEINLIDEVLKSNRSVGTGVTQDEIDKLKKRGRFNPLTIVDTDQKSIFIGEKEVIKQKLADKSLSMDIFKDKFDQIVENLNIIKAMIISGQNPSGNWKGDVLEKYISIRLFISGKYNSNKNDTTQMNSRISNNRTKIFKYLSKVIPSKDSMKESDKKNGVLKMVSEILYDNKSINIFNIMKQMDPLQETGFGNKYDPNDIIETYYNINVITDDILKITNDVINTNNYEKDGNGHVLNIE